MDFIDCSLNDPQIGLMGNIEFQVPWAKSMFRQHFLVDIGHTPNGVLENVFAVLMHVMHFIFNGFRRRGIEASTGRHVQELAAASVTSQDEIDDSALTVLGGLHKNGSRAIAEQ